MDEFIVMYLDMLGRRKVLEDLLVIFMFINSFLLILFVFVGNVVVVLFFIKFIKLVDNVDKRKVWGKGNWIISYWILEKKLVVNN